MGTSPPRATPRTSCPCWAGTGTEVAAVIDSQAVKTSPVRGDARGYDAGKKIWGRKRQRHGGHPGLGDLRQVLAANITDREGAKVLLTALIGKLPRLLLIWADSGYEGKFEAWVKEHLVVRLEIVKHPWTGIRGIWAPEGVKVDWEKIIPKGFHVLPRRWVVERTNA